MSNADVIEMLHRHEELRDRWVAIDPRGGDGLVVLRSGAVVVDWDSELDALCQRIDDDRRTSLTILHVGRLRRVA